MYVLLGFFLLIGGSDANSNLFSRQKLHHEIGVNFEKSVTKTPLTEEFTKNNYYWYDMPGAKDFVLRNQNIPEWLKTAAVNFIDNGYTIIKDTLSHEMCDAAIESFKEWVSEHPEEGDKNRDEYGHYNRMYNLHTSKKAALHIMTRNYKTLMLMDFLFGAKTSIGTTIFFSRGSQQNMHVDIPFFWTVPGCRFFGVWAALEDVDEDNGPLMVLKGGHRCNVLEQRHELPELLRLRGSVDQIKREDGHAFNIYGSAVLNNCAAQNITDIHNVYAKKGDTIIWHPLLPHGGSKILDPKRSRFSLISHEVPEMTPLYSTDAFFNPDLEIDTQPYWDYRIEKGATGTQDFRLVGSGEYFTDKFANGY